VNVKPSHPHYLSQRALKVNVGFLLSAGPGLSQDSRLDSDTPIQVADDLIINDIHGTLRLTRTKEGVLVQSRLQVSVDAECSRCLDTTQVEVPVDVEELYMHPTPIPGHEFFVGADAILDLAPLIRAETLIQTSQRVLCREDCKGLCPTCGANRNHEPCDCDANRVDPRFAGLRALLDSSGE
jgi:uncharacterized protein